MYRYALDRPRLSIRVSLSTNTTPGFAADVFKGLSADPKRLNPMYFYDAEGSLLFERICRLPEYYVTRTEREILAACADEISECSAGSMSIVEFGSGSSEKTRLLIEAMLRRQGTLCYTPVDISSAMIIQSAHRLLDDYPGLRIEAQVAEYRAGLRALMEEGPRRKLIVFMGSNLGNFDPAQALEFLRGVRNSMSKDDYFMIGNDLAKQESVLVRAYDDAQGITAAFNLNLLRRINRELGGRFDVSLFSHVARYNADQSRIEMYLKSRKEHTVPIENLGTSVRFEQGETIHTENSYKYSTGQLDRLFGDSGFSLVKRWFDPRRWFSISLLRGESGNHTVRM